MLNIYFDRDIFGNKGDQVYVRSLIESLEENNINYRIVPIFTYIDNNLHTINFHRIVSFLYALIFESRSIKHAAVYSLKSARKLNKSDPGIIIGMRLASLVMNDKLHLYHLIDLESNKAPLYLPKFLRKMELFKLRREEQRLVHFPKFFVSNVDVRSFPSNSFNFPLRRNPNIYGKAESNLNRVIFWGNQNYTPNIEAVKFLINLKKYEELKFLNFDLIGPDLPPKLVNECNKIGINYMGYVPDLCQELLNGGIAVFPIYGGGGVQNKFLEAVSIGLPVLFSDEVGKPFGLSHIAVENRQPSSWIKSLRFLIKYGQSQSLNDIVKDKVFKYHDDKNAINQIIKFNELYISQN